MATTAKTTSILAEESREKREELVDLLERAYWMEIETVMSYIANSINPDGVRAQEIAEALADDVLEELGHARAFAQRIKELYGVVPGSLAFEPEQRSLQPPDDQTDIVHVIRGVIEAETGAIEHYGRIIDFCDGVDYVTQDMMIDVLRDEERHRRLFEGFLREFERARRRESAPGAPRLHASGLPAFSVSRKGVSASDGRGAGVLPIP